MIADHDFSSAMHMLSKLTYQDPNVPQNIEFSEEWHGQNPIISTIKILHKSALQGSEKQKSEF